MEIRALCDRIKTPNEERELALLACRCKDLLNPSKPGEFLNLLKRADAFRPFVRLDDARNLDQTGTGLGLAIALDIARAHGGELRLEDSPKGGLRAVIQIPV